MSDSTKNLLPVDTLLESVAVQMAQGLVFDCENEIRRKVTERISLKRIQTIASAFTDATRTGLHADPAPQAAVAPVVQRPTRRLVQSDTATPRRNGKPPEARSIAIPMDLSKMDEFQVRYQQMTQYIEGIRRDSEAVAPRAALLVSAQLLGFAALFALIHLIGTLTGFVVFLGCSTIAYECFITARRF